MAISSTGGADVTDTGGPLISTPGGVIAPESGSQGVQTPIEGVRPPWLPEGFETEAEFAAAWDAPRGPNGELVKPTAAGAETTSGQESTSGTDTITGGAAKDALPEGARSDDEIKASLKEAGGIFADERYEAGAIEFERTGDVSPETRAKIAEAFGVPANAVDGFIEGQKALRAGATAAATADQAKAIAEVHAVIGSEADYGKFMEWSKENLSNDEKVAYNEALDKAPAAAKVMLAGFNEKYKSAGNGAPRDLTEEARGGTAAATAGYASSAEMQTAMSDPRYESDPAFRAQVAAKVAISKF